MIYYVHTYICKSNAFLLTPSLQFACKPTIEDNVFAQLKLFGMVYYSILLSLSPYSINQLHTYLLTLYSYKIRQTLGIPLFCILVMSGGAPGGGGGPNGGGTGGSDSRAYRDTGPARRLRRSIFEVGAVKLFVAKICMYVIENSLTIK